MSVSLPRRTRWAVPVAAGALVVTGFVVGPALAGADSSGLPPVTAAELVAKVEAAKAQPLSGTVVYSADLGLPDLSSVSTLTGKSFDASPLNLLSGTQTLQVWTDAAGRSRVSLQGATSEYSVVTDKTQAWTYSSSQGTATHYTLSAADAAAADRLRQQAADGTLSVPGSLPTPTATGDQAISELQKYSTLSLDGATTVAGRDVYQLVLTPTSSTTLVSRVVVAIDAATSTPLRVQVWSRELVGTPALEVGFTDVTFATPSDRALTWSTPSGVTLKEVTVPLPSKGSTSGSHSSTSSVTTTGTGWDTVVKVTGLPTSALSGAASGAASALPGALPSELQQYAQAKQQADDVTADPSALLDRLATKVDGGRLISSHLGSVLIRDDGTVLAGAVPAATLTALAG